MANIQVGPSQESLNKIPMYPLYAAAITPSDTDTYPNPVTVYVGVTGDVAVEPAQGGNTVTFKSVPAGVNLPVRVRRVLATGTTATSLVATA